MIRILRPKSAALLFLATVLIFRPAIRAQTVWSGLSYSFTKVGFGSPTDPTNQDRITSNVWLTRGNNQGLFNANGETIYGPESPAGTRWATDINNPGKTIAATNWSNLSFTDWVDAYGGQGSMSLPANLLSRNAVLYLVADSTYLDIQFTGWSQGGGGGFSYNRAPAPPPLTTGDYNHNGVVDAADYVVWRDTLNQTASPAGSGADGNSSGTIDAGDFSFWRAHFGNPAGSGLGAANVPEPTLLTLVTLGLTLVGFMRRGRKASSSICLSARPHASANHLAWGDERRLGMRARLTGKVCQIRPPLGVFAAC